MKTILFVRVSTKEQAEEGYSLDAQRKLLEDYASKKLFNITHRFIVPESASGRQERKQFNEMIEYLFSHPEIKILLCEKVDRISRNFKDAIKLDEWLNENEERAIHFVKQNLVIHKNARSHEKFQWDIYLVLAKQYSNNLSEETKKGMQEKANQGFYPGGSYKRGYKSVGEVGRKLWIIDDSVSSEAPYIRRAFELYDTGNFTLAPLCKLLFQEGWTAKSGKRIAISEMHKILIDCFYCGDFEWNGIRHKNAKHDALISKELFNRVQDRLRRKITGKYRKHTYLFNSLIKCEECGRSVSGEIQKGNHYYRCTRFETNCTQRKYAREEKLEEQVLSLFDKIEIKNVRLAEWLKNALKESHAQEIEYHNAAVQDLNSRHTRTQQKIDTLYDEKIEGKITPEFYEKKLKQYSEELDGVITSIQKHKDANISYIELGVNILELSQRAKELYKTKADIYEKRLILSTIFVELKLKDGIVTPVFQPAFQVIAEKVPLINSQKINFELLLPSTIKAFANSDLKLKNLLPDLESNQN